MATTAVDRELTAAVQRYWLNFAATGDPNAAALPGWPVFERSDPRVQQFGDEVRTVPAPEPGLCAAFEAWLEER